MPRILIVEDDKYLNKLLADRFSIEGFDVRSALDGEEAREILEASKSSKDRFDIVLSDMLLPRLMGAQLFTHMNEDPEFQSIKKIGMSGIYKESQQTAEITSLHGLSSYWVKPFSLDDLVKSISDKGPTNFLEKEESGDLVFFPLERIFLQAYSEGFNGKLILHRDGAERRIYFSNGFPVSADSTSIAESLGNSLVAMRYVDAATAEYASKQMVAEQIQFGQMLIKLGAITQDKLFEALRKHTYKLLLNSFAWRDGRYEFVKGELPAHVLPLEFNFVILIMKAQSVLFSSDFLKSFYETKMDLFCAKAERYFQILTLLNLDAGSFKFFKELSSIETLKDILKDIPPENREAVYRVLYCLESLQLIDWRSEAIQDVSLDTSLPDFYERTASTIEPSKELSKTLQSEYMDMLNKDFFQILEVVPESSQEQLDESYRNIRYRLHPDRFESKLSGEAKRILDDMLARLDKAYQTLNDPAEKEKYLSTQKKMRTDSLMDSKNFLEAQNYFREALRLLGNQNYREAGDLFRKAHSLWNRGAEYEVYAIYCDLRVAVTSKKNDDAERILLKIKSEAIQNRSNDVAFMLLGHAYQALEKFDLAQDAYKTALQNNDKNEEAANSLARLADIRIKKGRFAKRISENRSGIKRSIIWLLILGAAVGLYFQKDRLLFHDVEVQSMDPKTVEGIFPARKIYFKRDKAKVLLAEGWFDSVPQIVLNTKCIEFLDKAKAYGIMEAYFYDEKQGIKAQCRGQLLKKF